MAEKPALCQYISRQDFCLQVCVPRVSIRGRSVSIPMIMLIDETLPPSRSPETLLFSEEPELCSKHWIWQQGMPVIHVSRGLHAKQTSVGFVLGCVDIRLHVFIFFPRCGICRNYLCFWSRALKQQEVKYILKMVKHSPHGKNSVQQTNLSPAL